jgi:hypothetical protein
LLQCLGSAYAEAAKLSERIEIIAVTQAPFYMPHFTDRHGVVIMFESRIDLIRDIFKAFPGKVDDVFPLFILFIDAKRYCFIQVMGLPYSTHFDIWHQLKDEGFRVAICSVDCVDTFHNKMKFHSFISESDFKYTLPAVYTSVDTASFPLVLKTSLRGEGGSGVRIINNSSDLKGAVRGLSGADYIMQEAIMSNFEYTYSYVAYRGRLLMTAERELCVQFELPSGLALMMASRLRGDIIDCRKIPNFAGIRNLVSELVKSTAYDGLACIQFKIPKMGPKANESHVNVKIIDVNPRVCGGTSRDSIALSVYLKAWWRLEEKFKIY